MGFETAKTYLDTLIEDKYEQFVETSSMSDFPKKILGEVFDDTDWDNVFDEPCLQIIFKFSDYEDYDQWFLSDGGFAMSERSMNEFARRYKLTPNNEKNLFRSYVQAFLDANSNCPIGMITELPFDVLELMFELKYFEKKYSEDELSEMYELTEDTRFLTPELKELFIF